VTAGQTTAQVATAIKNVIDPSTNWLAYVDGSIVVIRHTTGCAFTSSYTAGSTGVTISSTPGQTLRVKLGYLE